jgi:thiamine biosynthesis lipoprotein
MAQTTTIPALDWAFPAMGTRWRVHHGGAVDGAAAQAAADLVRADERRWSRFLPTSDTARISAGAAADVAVAPETLELIAAALVWQARTAGRFDPLVGRALQAAGYRDGHSADAAAGPAADRVRLDRERGVVRIPADERLDLGGIGKSWSARRAGALLARLSDDRRIVVDAGGDIHVERGDELVATAAGAVRVRAGHGVCTSSSERRSWNGPDGARAHHLIDAASGRPGARGTAVVTGADVVACDVLATCLVLDPGLLAALELPAARIDPDGAISVNDRWSEVAA